MEASTCRRFASAALNRHVGWKGSLNILLLAGGGFAGLERLLETRLRPDRFGIGFHAEPEVTGAKIPRHKLFEETHPDDLRHFGLIPEFIGRFPVITALHALDEAALVRILTEPKNALVRQYQQLFAFEGVRLEFTPEALTANAQKAIQRATGARGLRTVQRKPESNTPETVFGYFMRSTSTATVAPWPPPPKTTPLSGVMSE